MTTATLPQSRILVLNKHHKAVSIASVQRAFGLLMSNYRDGTPKARIVDQDYNIYTWEQWADMRPLRYIFCLKDGREICCNMTKEEGMYFLTARDEEHVVLESEVKSYRENVIKTVNCEFQLPSVILLSHYEKMPQQRVHFSRRTIYKRDAYTCFTPDTLIMMGDGKLLPICEVKTGDFVCDVNGNKSEVEYVHVRQAEKGEVINIKHRGNGDYLKCTLNHKIIPFKWDGSHDLNGMEANKFSLNSYVGEIIPKIEKESIEQFDLASVCHGLKHLKIYEKSIKHYSGNICPRFIKSNNELGKLVGYYLSEGSTSQTNVVFTFNSSEICFMQEVKHILLKMFDCKTRFLIEGNKASVVACSSVLSCFFKTLFGKNDGKCLPWKNFSVDFLRGVLYGVLRGDAAFNDVQSRCALQMSRPTLIRDIYLASLACGFLPTLSKTGQREDGRIYKSINFNAREYNEICELCNIPYSKYELNGKYDRNKVGNHLVSKIADISETSYAGPVYDLQVSGNHTYVANFVCVHNCQYCGAHPNVKDLSIDHIVPKAQHGKTTWENTCLACLKCNSHKANRTPEQANMRLLSVPKKPKFNLFKGDRVVIPKSWENWVSDVYWDIELENDMD